MNSISSWPLCMDAIIIIPAVLVMFFILMLLRRIKIATSLLVSQIQFLLIIFLFAALATIISTHFSLAVRFTGLLITF